MALSNLPQVGWSPLWSHFINIAVQASFDRLALSLEMAAIS